MVEALSVETFRGSGLFTVVEDSRGSFPAEYLLQITIRRFEAEYGGEPGAPVVHVSLECMLGRQPNRELLASFIAESTESAAGNKLSAVVAAFERAADSALATAAERTATAIRTSTSRSPP